MKMVVGLGNPGQKYAATRHNVGYEVIAELARRHQTDRTKTKFNGEFAETIVENTKTLLVSPLTYMNLSGQCVRAAVDFFKLELDDLLIVCDDFNLPLGRIRLRPSGSAGGQNGLKDIIQRLGTMEFPRLRLGIGQPPPGWDVSGYVLGKIPADQQEAVSRSVRRSAEAVETWIGGGIQAAMNQFNVDPDQKQKQKPNRKSESDQDQGDVSGRGGGNDNPKAGPTEDSRDD